MKGLMAPIPYKGLIFNAFYDMMAQIMSISGKLSATAFNQKGWQILFFMVLLSPEIGFSQGRNPYHLLIATRKKEYKQQIVSAPLFQLVDLEKHIPGIKTDIRYATSNNFTRQVLYPDARVFLRKIAADPLRLANDSLLKMGLCLLVFDGYRPYATTLKMWEIVPDDRYAANPANGSGHNRGIAVDVTLADALTGKPLPMPTDFDNFSDTAHHAFSQMDSIRITNRALLKNIMMYVGFVPLSTEWWHYYLPNAASYPLMDFRFNQINRWIKKKERHSTL